MRPAGQERTLQWLDHHDFYRRTASRRQRVLLRLAADKAGHCGELGITHMVDDRLDVHAALRDLVPNLYLFGPQEHEPPEWVRQVPTWADLEGDVTPSW